MATYPSNRPAPPLTSTPKRSSAGLGISLPSALSPPSVQKTTAQTTMQAYASHQTPERGGAGGRVGYGQAYTSARTPERGGGGHAGYGQDYKYGPSSTSQHQQQYHYPQPAYQQHHQQQHPHHPHLSPSHSQYAPSPPRTSSAASPSRPPQTHTYTSPHRNTAGASPSAQHRLNPAPPQPQFTLRPTHSRSTTALPKSFPSFAVTSVTENTSAPAQPSSAQPIGNDCPVRDRRTHQRHESEGGQTNSTITSLRQHDRQMEGEAQPLVPESGNAQNAQNAQTAQNVQNAQQAQSSDAPGFTRSDSRSSLFSSESNKLRIKRSKSDLLRRLSKSFKEDETISGGKYVPLSGVDADAEMTTEGPNDTNDKGHGYVKKNDRLMPDHQRLPFVRLSPAFHSVSSHSDHDTNEGRGITHSETIGSFKPSSFPMPPVRSTSDDTRFNSQSNGPNDQAKSDVLAFPIIPPSMSRSNSTPLYTHDYAHPVGHANSSNADEIKRVSDPATGIHSRNYALIAAENGGKSLSFYAQDGTWSANSLNPTPLFGTPERRGSNAHANANGDDRGRMAPRPRSSGPDVFSRNDPHLVGLDDEYGPGDARNGSGSEERNRHWDNSTSTLSQPHAYAHPRRHVRSLSEGATLARQGTLLHPASDTSRASQELGIVLGNRKRRTSAGKILPPPQVAGWEGGGIVPEKIRLEAAKKGKARVEVDVVLERECVVEGGEIRGRVEVRVAARKGGVRVGHGKVRVVGYEDVSNQSRHIFYHHSHTPPVFVHPPDQHGRGPRTSLFASGPDSEGFHAASEGTHFIPFSMRLPLRGGAKGAFTSPANPKGPAVRYVVVGSVKLVDPATGKRSIAHFYRPIVVLPYLNPGIVLAPSEETVEVVERRGLGWSLGGAKGSVELRIALGRSIWVAGQRVWCEVGVRNDSSKKIKTLTLALLQNVQTFIPDDAARVTNARLSVDKDGIPNADEALGIASTTRRKVAEESIEADETDWGAGKVTGRQWWTGVDPGEMGGWDLSLLIPNGVLTIPRSRLIEVTYTLRLTANSSIYVDVPVTLINFLSIDPPPMPGDGARLGSTVPIPLEADMPIVGIASTEGHAHNRGPYGGLADSQHSHESANHAARASSTTLHIDALLSAGRARAEAEARANYPPNAHPRANRPLSMISDYNTDPTSSRSQLGTLGTSRSMPNGLRAGALPEGATPARPKAPRVMSYLSIHSSELDQVHSEDEEDTEEQDEEDEEDKAMRAAARREGRKMSLAALTRAAEREKEDIMQSDDLLSPTREMPHGMNSFFPAETPYEEAFKVLGGTPTMSGTGSDAATPVPPTGSGLPVQSESNDVNGESTRRGYSEELLQPITPLPPMEPFDGYGLESGKRSHDAIPEEEEPASSVGHGQDREDVGDDTILEDLVPDHGDQLERSREGPEETPQSPPFAYEFGTSPDGRSAWSHSPRSPTTLRNQGSYSHSQHSPFMTTISSTGATGQTASSLRVPSRRGSALDSQTLLSVSGERETHIQQARSIYGSIAASAVSEQESEVGQVVEAIKRNLSVRAQSSLVAADRRGEEEVHEDNSGRGPSSTKMPSPSKYVPRSGSFSRSPHSPGISPRSNHPPTMSTAEPMLRLPSGPSLLRNQVKPPSPASEKSDDDLMPALAPSVEGDSSSEGHDLDSPEFPQMPTTGPGSPRDKILQTLQSIDHPSTPKPRLMGSKSSADLAPILDPTWVPGDHLLHTEVAYARTSFSVPAGPTSSDSHDTHHASTDYNHSAMSISHRRARPISPVSTRSMKSAHSSHSVVPSSMQTKLKQMEARDEALRKFSVASAASGGRRDSQRSDGLPPTPVFITQPSSENREIKQRRSHTTALGPRPAIRPMPIPPARPQFKAHDNDHVGGTSYVVRRPFAGSPPRLQDVPRLELTFSSSTAYRLPPASDSSGGSPYGGLEAEGGRMDYGPDVYGSEQGSVASRSGMGQGHYQYNHVEPRRVWVNRGSAATEDSDGLL